VHTDDRGPQRCMSLHQRSRGWHIDVSDVGTV
jgi:hypothetical protein